MSTAVESLASLAADAAAGSFLTSMSSMRKRKAEDNGEEPELKVFKTDGPPQTSAFLSTSSVSPPQTSTVTIPSSSTKQVKANDHHEGTTTPTTCEGSKTGGDEPPSRARSVRLEQNRKAARESRRRKKVMIEELQRSVIFFSRANSTLKQQNDDLTRLLLQAQASVSAVSGQGSTGNSETKAPQEASAPPVSTAKQETDQLQAQTVATQAMYESQGYPAAAARAAAQAINSAVAVTPAAATVTSPAPSSFTGGALPTMQPGATMQAMANFQQAAAAAMQVAIQGMQSIPGVNLTQLAMAPPAAGTNAQQAYTDTMTALAMQQAAAAAAAAAGQQFAMHAAAGLPFLPPHAMQMAWQQYGQQQAAALQLRQQQQAQAQQQQQAQAQQQQQQQATEAVAQEPSSQQAAGAKKEADKESN
jgi:hypothetical protein